MEGCLSGGSGVAVGQQGQQAEKPDMKWGETRKLATHTDKPEPIRQTKPTCVFHHLYLKDMFLLPQRCAYIWFRRLKDKILQVPDLQAQQATDHDGTHHP